MPDSSLLRADPGARVETPLCRLAQELAALTGWRRYGLGFLLGALLAGALAAGRSDAAGVRRVSGPAVARRGQRRSLGVGSARLCLRPRLLRRRPLLDRGGAVCRYRPLLVGRAVRRVRPARVPGAVFRRGARPDRLRRAPVEAGAGGADLPVRGSVERGRMAARPCPDRVSVEPGRLCLGRRFPGGARDAAEHRLDRHLRAEFPDRAGGLAAGVARRHVADRRCRGRGAPRRRSPPRCSSWCPLSAGAIRLGLLPTRPTDTWLRLVQPSVPQGIKWDPASRRGQFPRPDRTQRRARRRTSSPR